MVQQMVSQQFPIVIAHFSAVNCHNCRIQSVLSFYVKNRREYNYKTFWIQTGKCVYRSEKYINDNKSHQYKSLETVWPSRVPSTCQVRFELRFFETHTLHANIDGFEYWHVWLTGLCSHHNLSQRWTLLRGGQMCRCEGHSHRGTGDSCNLPPQCTPLKLWKPS